jgi:CRP-like cAMP-binding protein
VRDGRQPDVRLGDHSGILLAMDAAPLRSIPLFASLSEKERGQLAAWMDVVDLPAGKNLTEEGAFAYEFMVIGRGTAAVSEGDRHVSDLDPGDYLGEIGLLGGERRRTASVITTSPMQAFVMAGSQFRAMTRDLPAVAEHNRTTIRTRLGEDS